MRTTFTASLPNHCSMSASVSSSQSCGRADDGCEKRKNWTAWVYVPLILDLKSHLRKPSSRSRRRCSGGLDAGWFSDISRQLFYRLPGPRLLPSFLLFDGPSCQCWCWWLLGLEVMPSRLELLHMHSLPVLLLHLVLLSVVSRALLLLSCCWCLFLVPTGVPCGGGRGGRRGIVARLSAGGYVRQFLQQDLQTDLALTRC